MCQLKKKPNTRISLTKKVDQNRSASNGWNDREFDDSSNSNSLDGAFMDDTTTISTSKEKPKLMKSETDVLKNDSDISETITTTNRRKRNRAHKAVIATEEMIETDDEKSLNICWNTDEPVKIKEESISPVDDAQLPDSGNNITDDEEMPIKDIKTEEVIVVKEEKRTRTANGGSIKIHESKQKSKLTSSHCKYCFKKFSNASNLRRHITMSHFGPKKFTCNLCTFRARRKNDILSHMRTKHQMDGERTEALKFVTVYDELAPKPQGSFSRRKDKHTEVLQDDEEEIYIDSEAFVIEESSDQLLTLDKSHENSNADMDDDSNNQANETTNETLSIKSNSNSKRKGRPKTKDKIKSSERSLSPADQKESESLPARRPFRNRIMPVKKDFVYDLSTLLKKEYKDFQSDDFQKQSLSQPPQAQPQSQPASQPPLTQNKSRNVSPVTIDNKAPKRRHLLSESVDSSDIQLPTQTQTEVTKTETHKSPTQQSDQTNENVPNPKKNDVTTIKGAAEAMAQQAVQSNRAVFFKPPELPTERPAAKTQRQFDSTTMKDWPVLKRPPAILDGLKSKLSNLKVPGLKRKKRTCLLKHGSNKRPLNHKNRINDKKNAGTNGYTEQPCNDLEQPIPEKIKISAKLADKIQQQCAQIENTDDEKAIKSEVPLVNTKDNDTNAESESNKQTETSSPRRMTLLERLAENKTKKLNESLSRMTIANSDCDSEED